MEKGCGSTIWRTYKSEIRGKPERVRRDDPTDPWVELSRKTCSDGPRSRITPSDILISKVARRCSKAAVAAGVREAGRSSLVVREPLTPTTVSRVLADYSGPIMGNPGVIAMKQSQRSTARPRS
jgi:hypothetical protein